MNDSIGHPAGDKLLIEIAERLKSALRGMDTIAIQRTDQASDVSNTLARVGGDEFTILLEDLSDPHDAVRVAERIQQAIASSLMLGGQELFTSASIGITVVSSAHRCGDDLIRDADLAMYRAKKVLGNKICCFERGMDDQVRLRRALALELREALAREELELHYQVQKRIATNEIIGYEALLRQQFHGDFPALLAWWRAQQDETLQ